ncbi:MAG: hypothetical protein HOI23_12550 [Deltaproteobacteria bacterium]|jgi:hypothetical protein|nr:hypothetical protein [Deltaproteobacteria bacterium]MBT6434815.1 hypothetical protein [Deltaproteobacteria bacterium]MBT6492250.1 hypothetical protein [Deltaproteobacteria bacterium]
MTPRPLAFILISLLLTACGASDTGPATSPDEPAQSGNTAPNADESDPSAAADDPADPAENSDPSDASDATEANDDPADTDESDVTDTEPEPDPIDPACDVDQDGYASYECGGDDCEDGNFYVNPGQLEYCDFLDNDCSTIINDGITCNVYAHTASTLYEVEPFLGTITEISTVPGLFDFDTSTEGILYGITPSSLYVYDEETVTWSIVSSISGMAGTANGFAIDSTGRAFATSGSNAYSVDLTTGTFELVGNMGSQFNSSGDCVVDKSDGLFMTSNGTGATNGDDLVQINTTTGAATVVGSTGFSGIYGLTAAWGNMFGFTGSGQLILLDSETYSGTLLHQFPGLSFYGAASSQVR